MRPLPTFVRMCKVVSVYCSFTVVLARRVRTHVSYMWCSWLVHAVRLVAPRPRTERARPVTRVGPTPRPGMRKARQPSRSAAQRGRARAAMERRAHMHMQSSPCSEVARGS